MVILKICFGLIGSHSCGWGTLAIKQHIHYKHNINFEEISLPWPDTLYHLLRLRNPSSSSCVCHLPIACAQHMPTWMPIGVLKRHDLACIEMVMARYPKLCVPCTRWVDTLACNLSREASFGVDIYSRNILTLNRELLGLFTRDSEEGDLSEFWQQWYSKHIKALLCFYCK